MKAEKFNIIEPFIAKQTKTISVKLPDAKEWHLGPVLFASSTSFTGQLPTGSISNSLGFSFVFQVGHHWG